MAEEKLSNNEQTTAGTDNAAQEATNSTGFDLGVVIERAKAVVTAPISFYKTMPTSGGYAEPIIFVVVMSLITASCHRFRNLRPKHGRFSRRHQLAYIYSNI